MPRHAGLSTGTVLLQPCGNIRRFQGNVCYGTYLDHGCIINGHRAQPAVYIRTGIGIGGTAFGYDQLILRFSEKLAQLYSATIHIRVVMKCDLS
jgi:hypothetical protein